jgi:hypothetical protein
MSLPETSGLLGPTGAVTLNLIRGGRGTAPEWPLRPVTLGDIATHALPRRGLPDHVNQWRLRNTRHLWRGFHKIMAARALHVPHMYGQLWLTVFRGDGTVDELGLASLRVVTDVGVQFIVDAFQNTTELENLKFHGYGTGGAAEAVGNTALTTEETTQYVSDNVRPTGSTTEGASANIYRTVATYSPDSGGTRAITEHGVFSATSAGTLLDRSLFSTVNLVASSDSLQTTYDCTFSSGG